MTALAVKTVLYVEDHEPNVFLVQAIFAPRADIQVITASTGRAGLQLAQERTPRLILLDLHLPDMHGERFLQRMREIPSLAMMPVIVLSADVAGDGNGTLAALGISEYISKPFDIDQFERIVDRWLENY